MGKSLRIPHVGRLVWLPGDHKGSAEIFAGEQLVSHLMVDHYRKGKLIDRRDLGSGKVTNVGVNFWVLDATWLAAATPFCTIQTFNYHTTGTGVTAEAQADFGIQTPGTHFGGAPTNNYYTGTQSITAPNIYKTVGVVTYNGSEAVTEWGLFHANGASLSRTSAGAAPTGTTFTDTGATFVTAGNGQKGYAIEIASSVLNTPTTTVMATVTSNTATVLTMLEGWWTLANAGASTPGATVAYQLTPTMIDHKNFAALNVVNLDQLTFSYSLTITAGG